MHPMQVLRLPSVQENIAIRTGLCRAKSKDPAWCDLLVHQMH